MQSEVNWNFFTKSVCITDNYSVISFDEEIVLKVNSVIKVQVLRLEANKVEMVYNSSLCVEGEDHR